MRLAKQTEGPVRTGRPYVYFLLGMCFALAFPCMFMGHTAPDVRAALGDSATYLYQGLAVVTLVTVALLSRRGLTLKDRPPLLVGASLACAAGAALTIVVASIPSPEVALAVFIAGTLLAAAGNSVLLLAWYELLAGLSLDYALLYYAASGLLAAGLQVAWFAASLPAGALPTALICVMPLASLACFLPERAGLAGAPYAQGERVTPHWDFPWAPALLLGIFALARKFYLNCLQEDVKGYAALAALVCYAVLLAMIVLGFKRFPYQVMRCAVLPLALAGMLCIVNGAAFVLAGAVLTRAAQVVLLFYVVSLLFDLTFRRGVNALWVFGLALACDKAGSLTANLVTVGLGDALALDGAHTLAISILILVMCVAFTALAPTGAPAQGWGAGEDVHDGGVEAEQRALAQACSHAARRFDLTRREEDVLLMRLKGATLKEVEEGLVISHNTVKSHVRHIYAKLGVASIEEAAEVVQSCR